MLCEGLCVALLTDYREEHIASWSAGERQSAFLQHIDALFSVLREKRPQERVQEALAPMSAPQILKELKENPLCTFIVCYRMRVKELLFLGSLQEPSRISAFLMAGIDGMQKVQEVTLCHVEQKEPRALGGELLYQSLRAARFLKMYEWLEQEAKSPRPIPKEKSKWCTNPLRWYEKKRFYYRMQLGTVGIMMGILMFVEDVQRLEPNVLWMLRTLSIGSALLFFGVLLSVCFEEKSMWVRGILKNVKAVYPKIPPTFVDTKNLVLTSYERSGWVLFCMIVQGKKIEQVPSEWERVYAAWWELLETQQGGAWIEKDAFDGDAPSGHWKSPPRGTAFWVLWEKLQLDELMKKGVPEVAKTVRL